MNATETQFLLSHKRMKTFCCILLTVLIGTACDKPIISDIRFVDLDIVHTNTPKTATVNQDLVSQVRVAGWDLCYNFAYFTVNKQQYTVDIHAKGTYPTKPVACAQGVYSKDTILAVPITAPGTYILRFYNGAQLFKSDTVQVN